jgi:hypothetical protein
MRLARLLLRVRALDARDAAAAAAAGAAQAARAGSPWAPPAAAFPAVRPASSVPAREQQGGPPPAQSAAHDDRAGELQAALAAEGLSHSAVMAVLGWLPPQAAARLDVPKVAGRAAALMTHFGREHADRMLVM